MNLYKLIADSNTYQSVVFENEEDFDLLDAFNGHPTDENLHSAQLTMVEEDDFGKELIRGDYPSLVQSVPVFSDVAWNKIGQDLVDCCQAFPVEIEGLKFWVLNVYAIDVLDKEKSELELFKSTGRIFAINKFAFRTKQLPIMFKLVETAQKEVYVTEKFVDLVKEARLQGLEFEKLQISNQ